MLFLRRLRSDITRMTSQMEDTRSGVDVIRTTLKSTNDDVVTMSTSFTEFIAHFDNYSVAVASNFTTLTGEMLTSITTTNALSKKVSFYNSEFQSSTKELSTKLNAADTGLNQFKNFSLQKFEKLEKIVDSLDFKMVNRTTMELLMGQISQEILDVGTLAAANISSVETDMQQLTLTMQDGMKNASSSLESAFDLLKMKTKGLEDDVAELKNTDATLRNDLMAVSGSLEHLAGTHEDRWRNNDLSWVKNAASLTELTGAVDTLEEKIGVLEMLAPFLHHVNSSTISSIETLRSNITNLGLISETLKAGVSKLESVITILDMNTFAVSNSTTTLKKKTQTIESRVDKLQSEANEFLTGFAKLVDVQGSILQNVFAILYYSSLNSGNIYGII